MASRAYSPIAIPISYLAHTGHIDSSPTKITFCSFLFLTVLTLPFDLATIQHTLDLSPVLLYFAATELLSPVNMTIFFTPIAFNAFMALAESFLISSEITI